MAGFAFGADPTTTMTATELLQGKGFTIGDTFTDKSGNEWMFVLAGSAITQYDCVRVTTAFVADSITISNGAVPSVPAFATGAGIASGSYGWVLTRGSTSIRVAASCLPNVPLYTTATAGVLDDATASGTGALQVSAVAASTGTAGGATTVASITPVALAIPRFV